MNGPIPGKNYELYGKHLRKEAEIASIVAALLATIGFGGVFMPPTFLVNYYENADAIQAADKTPRQWYLTGYIICTATTAFLSMLAIASDSLLIYLINVTEENGKPMNKVERKFDIFSIGSYKSKFAVEDLFHVQAYCVLLSTILLGLAVLFTVWAKYYLYLWAKIVLTILFFMILFVFIVVLKRKLESQYMESMESKGQVDVVKLLLENGANVGSIEAKNMLRYAAENGQVGVFKQILGKQVILGAELLAVKSEALLLAAENGHVEVVKLLVDANTEADAEGRTALMCAAENGHAEVVKLLLESGAEVESVTPFRTALICAAEKGHVEVVKILLKKGADPAAVDENNWTALKHAENRCCLRTAV